MLCMDYESEIKIYYYYYYYSCHLHHSPFRINDFYKTQQVVNGSTSNVESVGPLSAVPQLIYIGRLQCALDPLLFLSYTNDTEQHLTSKIRLFADDSAIYRCHGLRVYAVCVCNKVRLPGTGQSAHVIGGSRFTRPASNLRRTLLN